MKKTLFMINLLSAALLFTSCGGTPGPTNPFLTLGENEYGVHVVVIARDVDSCDYLICFTNREDY